MKIKISFKTPDAVSNAIADAFGTEATDPHGDSVTVIDDDVYEKAEAAREKLRKWVMYGEYITIEFDLEAGTATVLPARG